MCIIQVTCEAGGECNALDQLYRPVPVSTITRGRGSSSHLRIIIMSITVCVMSNLINLILLLSTNINDHSIVNKNMFN